jgi:hypothetical protein
MSKTLIVGSDSFEFPEVGENPDWGSEVTDWAEAVTEALSTVQKPNDITLTNAVINNGVVTPTNINGFFFSTAEVKAIDSRYLISRSTVSPAVVITEVGYIEGYFDGTSWGISIRTVGDSSVSLSITPSGQIQYTSSTLAGTGYVGSIAFEAKVINNF